MRICQPLWNASATRYLESVNKPCCKNGTLNMLLSKQFFNVSLLLPLGTQQPHHDLVISLPVALDHAAYCAFTHETNLLINVNRPRIVRISAQADTIYIQLAEGIIDRQSQGIGAIALAAIFRLANPHAQPGYLMYPHN